MDRVISYNNIRTLGTYEIKSEMVLDCLEKLNRLGKENKFIFCWALKTCGSPRQATKPAKRGVPLH